jgi:hypothetical protein
MFPFTIATTKNKVPWNKVNKKTKVLFDENYEQLICRACLSEWDYSMELKERGKVKKNDRASTI